MRPSDRFIALGILTIALCAPTNVSAQPGVPLPTTYELQRLLLGAVNSARLIPLSEVVCGVDGSVQQPPGSIQWDDPAQFPATRKCQWTDPGNGPIRTAVVGVQYQIRMSATANPADGPSPWSPPLDFRIPAPTPAVPTGVRIRPGQ